MPVTLPTPDEWLAMNWHQRVKAANAARALLRAYGGVVEQTALHNAHKAKHTPARARWESFGEDVRKQARALERRRG